jgi:hypothetical protein
MSPMTSRHIAAISILAAILIGGSAPAKASSSAPTRNIAYLAQIRVPRDAQVAWLELKKREKWGHPVLQLYSRPNKSGAIKCDLGPRSAQNCGLQPVMEDRGSYGFIAKQIGKEWIEIFADQGLKRTLWLPAASESGPIRREELKPWFGRPQSESGPTIHFPPKLDPAKHTILVWLSAQFGPEVYLIDVFSSPDNKTPRTCELSESYHVYHKEGCGLVVLGWFYDDDPGNDSVAFLVKQLAGDWVEIYVDSSQKQTVWLPRVLALQYQVRTALLGEAVGLFYAGMKVLHPGGTGKVKILAADRDNADPVGECAGVAGNYSGEGASDRITGLFSEGEVMGDWVKVHCEQRDCYAPNSPNIPCDGEECDEDVVAARKAKLKPCISGWTRWRAKDGRVLLGPRLD